MKNLLLLFLISCSQTLFASEEIKINKLLNQFHQAASEADGETYFSLFAENAIFIGTDASETWTLEEFRNFTNPYFSKGKGWTYHPKNRHIYFSESKRTAWFDEMLDNDSYGVTRGTGVLIKINSAWKIAQYHLTIPVPNKLSKEIVELIKQNK